MSEAGVDPGPSLRPEADHDERFLRDLFAEVQGGILAALEPSLREMLLLHQRAGQRATYAARHPEARREIVEHGGVPVGRLVTDRGDGPDGAVLVVDIAIGAAWRGRGFGTRLLRNLQREASRAGKPLRLSVRAENAGARRLYARLGFAPVISGDIDIALEWRAPPAHGAGA